MPVIFQVSNWGGDDQLFDEWLANELHRRYGVPHLAAASFVEYRKIVPLLDGMDELPASRRASFITALNGYIKGRRAAVSGTARTVSGTASSVGGEPRQVPAGSTWT